MKQYISSYFNVLFLFNLFPVNHLGLSNQLVLGFLFVTLSTVFFFCCSLRPGLIVIFEILSRLTFFTCFGRPTQSMHCLLNFPGTPQVFSHFSRHDTQTHFPQTRCRPCLCLPSNTLLLSVFL